MFDRAIPNTYPLAGSKISSREIILRFLELYKYMDEKGFTDVISLKDKTKRKLPDGEYLFDVGGAEVDIEKAYVPAFLDINEYVFPEDPVTKVLVTTFPGAVVVSGDKYAVAPIIILMSEGKLIVNLTTSPVNMPPIVIVAPA